MTIVDRIVGTERVSLIPLTFQRVRLVVGRADDTDTYDDGW